MKREQLIVRVASRFALLAMVIFGSITPIAGAQSISIKRMPDSQMLEGSYTVVHDCVFSPAGEDCPWFGEASSYSSQNGICPESFDITHAIWIGEVATGNARETGTSTFSPEAAHLKICLYVNGDEVELVSEAIWPPSHSGPKHPSDCPALHSRGIDYSHIIVHHVPCSTAHRLLRNWSAHTEPGQHGFYAGWRFTAHSQDPSIVGTWRARRQWGRRPVETIMFTLS